MLDSAIQKLIKFYSRSFDFLGAPCQSWQNSSKWPFSKKSKKKYKEIFLFETQFPDCLKKHKIWKKIKINDKFYP